MRLHRINKFHDQMVWAEGWPGEIYLNPGLGLNRMGALLDRFEEIMKNAGGPGEEKKEKMAKENQERCNCPPCPTYAQCAEEKGELVFCLREKSSCIKDTVVCFCPDCPVHKDLGMVNMYYCLRGDEIEQRGSGSRK